MRGMLAVMNVSVDLPPDLSAALEVYAKFRGVPASTVIESFTRLALGDWHDVLKQCDHRWSKSTYQGKPDAVHCHRCQATPAEVIAAVGYVTMNCVPEHEISDPGHPFGLHIDSDWVGDDPGGFWECETVMPDWTQ